MEKRSLYATLIGINAYKQFPLGGCINDVIAIDLLLREQCSQQGKDKLIYVPKYFLAPSAIDKKRINTYKKAQKASISIVSPTFKNITTQAFEHLKKAKDGDICLFYYSGHGSQTDAPPEFWHSKPNQKNETLVCLDSRDNTQPDARDLVDKELAYLLWDALSTKNVHCLIIMDCCHSGNNTRGMAKTIQYREVVPSKTKIPLKDYLGFADGKFYEVSNGKAKIKTARYVHLAAALDTEKAEESSDGGLFSTKLIEVLRSGGTANSYRELMKNVGTSVRIRNTQQNPVPFALENEDLDQQFLGKGIIPYKPAFQVRHIADLANPYWRMYGGAMQGVVPSGAGAKTTVKINGSDKAIEVKEVFTDYSILDSQAMAAFDQTNETYKATIIQLAAPRILIGLSEKLLTNEKFLADLKAAYNQGQFIHFDINFEKAPANVAYLIHLFKDGNDNAYALSNLQNSLLLFKREKNATSFLNKVEAVGKWISINNMTKTNSKFTSKSFVFELEKIEGVDANNLDEVQWGKSIIQPDDEIVCNYVNGQRPIIRLKISIDPDASFSTCFVGALYMDCRYGISYNLIRPDESELRKLTGASIYLKTVEDGTIYDSIILELDEKFKNYNINEITDNIKIFISTKVIDLDNFGQPSLELDDDPLKIRTARSMGGRNRSATDDDWSIFNFKFRIVGPEKKKKLRSGTQTDFSAFTIQVPEGLNADAYAVTGNDLKDKLKSANTRSLSEEPDKQMLAIVPPAAIWGDAMTDLNFPKGLSSTSENSIEAIELFPENEAEELQIPEGKEMIISPKKMSAADTTRSVKYVKAELETIIPFGYDQDSELYFPIGYSDEDGNIHIQALPPRTAGSLNGQEAQTRSLGGSIKLYFKKLIRNKQKNALVLYLFNEKTGWKKASNDPTKMKAFMEINPDSNVLLLIHGITGDTKYMLEAIKEMDGLTSKANYILTYDYENLSSPISKTTEELNEALIAAGFGNPNMPGVIVIAHSMGGLVARWLVEKKGGDKFIKHLVMAGTPSAGSEMAVLGKAVLGMLTHAMNVSGPIKFAITGLSFLLSKLELDPLHTLVELKPDSDTLKNLGKSAMNKATNYSVIGGDTSLLKKGYNGDDAFLRKLAFAMMNNIVYRGLTISLFAGEPNDMAVTLKSMQSIPAFDQSINTKIVRSNHMGYFADKEALDHILSCLSQSKLSVSHN